MTAIQLSIEHHKAVKMSKRDLFRETLYMMELTGRPVYIDGQYIAIYTTGYRVGLVSYNRKFWYDSIGGCHCNWLPHIIWSDMSKKQFYFFLLTAGYYKTNKPKRFSGQVWHGKNKEQTLQSLLTWLKSYELHWMSDDKDQLLALDNWIQHSSYETVDHAIAEIEESLNGAYFVPM